MNEYYPAQVDSYLERTELYGTPGFLDFHARHIMLFTDGEESSKAALMQANKPIPSRAFTPFTDSYLWDQAKDAKAAFHSYNGKRI